MKLLQTKNIKNKIGVLLVVMHLAGAIGLSNEYSNNFFFECGFVFDDLCLLFHIVSLRGDL